MGGRDAEVYSCRSVERGNILCWHSPAARNSRAARYPAFTGERCTSCRRRACRRSAGSTTRADLNLLGELGIERSADAPTFRCRCRPREGGRFAREGFAGEGIVIVSMRRAKTFLPSRSAARVKLLEADRRESRDSVPVMLGKAAAAGVANEIL